MAAKNVLSRREFVKDTGGLLIGFSFAEGAALPQVLSAAADTAATPSPARLDAWLRIDGDGTVHVFTGKAEIGMGVETGLAQIVAEELDVPVGRVVLVMGDTSATTDQGGVGGSTSIMMGAKPLRNAAATARSLLLRMAANNLGVSPDQLQVRDGVISVASGASRKISYGELAANGKSGRRPQSFRRWFLAGCAGPWQAKGSLGLHRCRSVRPARRPCSQDSRKVAIRHRRARPRNAPRPRDSSRRSRRQAHRAWTTPPPRRFQAMSRP